MSKGKKKKNNSNYVNPYKETQETPQPQKDSREVKRYVNGFLMISIIVYVFCIILNLGGLSGRYIPTTSAMFISGGIILFWIFAFNIFSKLKQTRLLLLAIIYWAATTLIAILSTLSVAFNFSLGQFKLLEIPFIVPIYGIGGIATNIIVCFVTYIVVAIIFLLISIFLFRKMPPLPPRRKKQEQDI